MANFDWWNFYHEMARKLLMYKNSRMEPDNSYKMSGNQIQVRTLDLNCDFSAISSRLDDIANRSFGNIDAEK